MIGRLDLQSDGAVLHRWTWRDFDFFLGLSFFLFPYILVAVGWHFTLWVRGVLRIDRYYRSASFFSFFWLYYMVDVQLFCIQPPPPHSIIRPEISEVGLVSSEQ